MISSADSLWNKFWNSVEGWSTSNPKVSLVVEIKAAGDNWPDTFKATVMGFSRDNVSITLRFESGKEDELKLDGFRIRARSVPIPGRDLSECFEMADKGTLFLDEVGDIPSALQPKLLRVLQEQGFERLGSGRTHKVDIRLVAASNRSLVKMVARGQFRGDLYYRLNVFPVLLPALRERREDIPALVTHFVNLFSRRMGKQVDSIPLETMAAFQLYSWPGNIRELQNLVERAVILSREGVLQNPLHKNQTELMIPSVHRTRTYYSSKAFEDSDRALILETLEQARWVVGGPHGAAAKLGLKRTTLIAIMRRLDISRPISQEGTDVLGVARRDAQI